MLVNIRCTMLGRGLFRTLSVFVMCSFAGRIQMKSFHIMSICNVRFNKLTALLDTLVLVFVSRCCSLVTLLNAGHNIVSDQFYQSSRGTAIQGFIGFGNGGLNFTCRFQSGQRCSFPGAMNLDEGSKKLIFRCLGIFLALGALRLGKGRTNSFFILLFYPLEDGGDIFGLQGLLGILNDGSIQSVAVSGGKAINSKSQCYRDN